MQREVFLKHEAVGPEALARRSQAVYHLKMYLCALNAHAPQVKSVPAIDSPFSFAQPQLVIPEYCKDPVHPDHPTAGWLRRKKRDKRALTSSFVSRFFRLEYDAFIMRYTLSYGEESQVRRVSGHGEPKHLTFLCRNYAFHFPQLLKDRNKSGSNMQEPLHKFQRPLWRCEATCYIVVGHGRVSFCKHMGKPPGEEASTNRPV